MEAYIETYKPILAANDYYRVQITDNKNGEAEVSVGGSSDNLKLEKLKLVHLLSSPTKKKAIDNYLEQLLKAEIK